MRVPFRLHRQKLAGAVDVPELPAPAATVDGWSLGGTTLARCRLSREETSELSTVLHYVAIGVDTPWTYERAAELLEAAGRPDLGVAACDAWLALPAATGKRADATRGIKRRRSQLCAELAGAGRGPLGAVHIDPHHTAA